MCLKYLKKINGQIAIISNFFINMYSSCVAPVRLCTASVSDDDEQKRKEEEKISIELRKFWQDVLLIMDKAPENSSLHDVARLEYMVPDFAVPHATDAEAKVNSVPF